MNNGIYKSDTFKNETPLKYHRGSSERIELEKELEFIKNNQIEIPVIIGGKEYRTGILQNCVIPHDKSKVIAVCHEATKELVNLAIENTLKSKLEWQNMPYAHRMAIFKKAAYLASTSWRAKLNAATMLGQSKTIIQAEIDAACEMIDFFNINTQCLSAIYQQNPIQTENSMNRLEFRPLEGFVFAITPFNFTAIAANLPAAPAMAGNTVIWKPAPTSIYSSYVVYKLLEAAGLPAGVINFVPGNAPMIGEIVLNHPELNGIHFTGSTGVFNYLWKTVGANIEKYRNYPRIVGETGGKNFVLAHKTAHCQALIACLVRGAFEYQGQKCSATSRAYISKSVWDKIKDTLIAETQTIKMGDTTDCTNFIGAVIDEKSFKNIKSYIDFAKQSQEVTILTGGNCDDSVGFFIQPTIIETKNLLFKTMQEEIFGPVLTICVFEDEDYDKILEHCKQTSIYGLSGSIFAEDRDVIIKAEQELMYAAGNLYINDKTTGAVVGQSPFGGSRASGTNDKVGTNLNMLKWLNPRTIKEEYCTIYNYRYKND